MKVKLEVIVPLELLSDFYRKDSMANVIMLKCMKSTFKIRDLGLTYFFFGAQIHLYKVLSTMSYMLHRATAHTTILPASYPWPNHCLGLSWEKIYTNRKKTEFLCVERMPGINQTPAERISRVKKNSPQKMEPVCHMGYFHLRHDI